MRAWMLVWIVAFCVLISACGGGGGGGSNPADVPPPQVTELVWDEGKWEEKAWQ